MHIYDSGEQSGYSSAQHSMTDSKRDMLSGGFPSLSTHHLVTELTSSHKGWAKISNIQIILYVQGNEH